MPPLSKRRITTLGKARTNWGITLSQMARKADMATTTVYRLEEGIAVGRATASKYFLQLGFDLDRLARGENEQGGRKIDIRLIDEGAFIRVEEL